MNHMQNIFLKLCLSIRNKQPSRKLGLNFMKKDVQMVSKLGKTWSSQYSLRECILKNHNEILLVEVWTSTITLENCLVVSTTTKHTPVQWSNNSISVWNAHICEPKDMDPHVQRGFIYKTSEAAAHSCLPARGRVNKMWHIRKWSTIQQWEEMNDCHLKQHGWISHTQKPRYKLTYATWFPWYKVQNQTKPIHGDRSKNSDCFWE